RGPGTVLVSLAGRRAAAGGGPGAHPQRRLTLPFERLAEIAAGERTDLGPGVEGVADGEALDGLRERALEGLRDVALDDEALRGDAGLAGVLVAGAHRGRRRRVEVGIGEDDERVRPAELEDGLLERPAGEP